MQVTLGLDRVVKHDDGAVAGITLHVAEYLFARELVAIIAGHHIPHDDTEILLQQVGLPGEHVAVGRTEELALNQVVGIKHVAHILLGRGRHALYVIHRVVAHLVPPVPQLLEEVGIAGHIFAHTKEGSLYRIVVEDIEHPRRNLGDRTVVESEVDGLLVARDTPDGLGEQHAVKKRGLLYKHKWYI